MWRNIVKKGQNYGQAMQDLPYDKFKQLRLTLLGMRVHGSYLCISSAYRPLIFSVPFKPIYPLIITIREDIPCSGKLWKSLKQIGKIPPQIELVQCNATGEGLVICMVIDDQNPGFKG